MLIPAHTKKPRFYVSTGGKRALSSWGTLEDARACVGRFKHNDPVMYKEIVDIVETGPWGKKIHVRDR